MQQNDIELRNGYQMIPVAIAGVMAAAIGCVTHFFKISLDNVGGNTVSLFTTLGVLLLYGYDLNWMKSKIGDLAGAASMADVRFSQEDGGVLIFNLMVILCYIVLSILL